jgi:hypothetical protein
MVGRLPEERFRRLREEPGRDKAESGGGNRQRRDPQLRDEASVSHFLDLA